MSKEKIYPIVYNKDHYTVIANDVIKGKQDMTLQEARVIRLLITQVVKEDKDLKTYNCRIQDFATFLGVPKNNLYRDVKKLCDGLLDKKIHIGTGNPKEPWRIFQWLQLAQYDGNGNITLMLSNQIKPFVIELNKYFTQYQLSNILQMKSFYSIRLYELIKCNDGITRGEKDYHEFSIEELRKYFCCENKYKTTSIFNLKVIEIGVREINEKSDLILNPKYIYTGRAITSIQFYIHIKSKSKQMDGQMSLGGDADE